MPEQREKKQSRSRVKKNSSSLLIICLIVASILTAGFYIYLKQTGSDAFSGGNGDSEKEIYLDEERQVGQKSFVPSQEQNGEFRPAPSTNEPTPDIQQQTEAGDSESEYGVPQPQQKGNGAKNFNDNTDQNSKSVDSSLKDNGYAQTLIEQINGFYNHLDRQEYMKAYNLETSSKIHFSSLIQKLIDNPPVVTRETDDLYTLLKNTAHFFRILGKDNIMMLKGILDREKDSFEKTLKAFYSLTKFPAQLAREYSLVITPDSLYDYAGFFINTMGGRLYLFRRDSTSRMTVSFYAILVIDSSKDAGNDRHGLDLKGPINSLIDEIENAGNRLRLKEEYLDILFDLKEKYSY